MKKIVALVLCIMMLFSVSVTAFAAANSPEAGAVDKDGTTTSTSPKSGDIATTALSVTALAALAVAVVAKKREA